MTRTRTALYRALIAVLLIIGAIPSSALAAHLPLAWTGVVVILAAMAIIVLMAMAAVSAAVQASQSTTSMSTSMRALLGSIAVLIAATTWAATPFYGPPASWLLRLPMLVVAGWTVRRSLRPDRSTRPPRPADVNE